MPEAPATLTDYDVYLWSEGSHYRAYEKLGAHVTAHQGQLGVRFAVWAPNAREVSVVGNFNGWRFGANPMRPVKSSGVWETFIPGIGVGEIYKYAIHSHHRGYQVEKSDPFGFAAEVRPRTGSQVFDLAGYAWGDQHWMSHRRGNNALTAPMSVYEVHLGSWRRNPEEGNRWLTYREMAPLLADYAHHMGYTHVELLPISEHPFDGSWGYQPVGYFAPTSRFGTPHDFMAFVDTLHQKGLGVILDWVPAHFPRDQHGLGYFDGTHLYEHEDPRQGQHQDWGTFIFNFGRKEILNFLISNAVFWLDKYHIDGLRVDAVASMLYLDYSRKAGEWTPNRYGGRENIEAIQFLRKFNEQVYGQFPDTITIAEESTAWPQVSRPTYIGGLGFGAKWDMGWMHDTLDYMSLDAIHRKYHHNRLTFRLLYAFSENYVLPLSHDEVVHGKKSLLSKMPGDDWQKFASLRALYGYMFAQPGKKLLFQGNDVGVWDEWDHDQSVDWHLLQWPPHQGLNRFVRDLNTLYRAEPALHVLDCDPAGFEWIDCCDGDNSIISLLRKGTNPSDSVVVICNFTPVPRHGYLLGVPLGGFWKELINSDAEIYGGSGQGNMGGVTAMPVPAHGREHCITITVPPLAMVAFKPSTPPEGERGA